MASLRKTLLWLACFLAFALGAGSTAQARIPVQTCVAPLPGELAAQRAFDCSKNQTRFGPGDFAVQVRFAPVQPDRDDPLVLRTTSVWQGSERVVFHYADGTAAELAFHSGDAAKFMTIGAVFEFPIPVRAAPLIGAHIEVTDSANWRGVVVGAQLMTRSESARIKAWLIALYAAFGGLSLALLAYNLSLWAVLRHAFQLSYSAMVCALMGYTFTSSGIATLAFPALDNNDRQRLSYLFLGLAAIAGVRFMADFFGPRVIGPRLRLVAAVACAATLTSALGFALLAPWQGYWLDRAYFISCGATLLALIPVLISAWRARVRNLGLFILAWSAPIGVSLARAAYGIGLIGFSFWLDNGNLLALSLEGLLSTMLIVARLRDLSNERDRARAGEQTALRLANTDPLTGLLNRRAFIELAIGRPVVHRLLLLDIDHFKLINDQLGHDAGDDVLRAVAQVLQALRPHGSLAVRLGGEEFALLVPLPQVPDCLPESLLDAIRAKPMPHDWKVTASLGHADGVVTTEEDWKRLYRLADTALYRAKADGRDRSCRATNFGAARVA